MITDGADVQRSNPLTNLDRLLRVIGEIRGHKQLALRIRLFRLWQFLAGSGDHRGERAELDGIADCAD